MIVVDGHDVFGDHIAVLFMTGGMARGGGLVLDSLDLEDSSGSDRDANGAVLLKAPIEDVVVVADGGDGAQYEVAAGPSGDAGLFLVNPHFELSKKT
jgi:hypothetical protein